VAFSEITLMAERKEIVRQIVERVTVENEGKSERLHVSIDWIGGSQTKGVVIRPGRWSTSATTPGCVSVSASS
jgi:hypothetical protein